jgi:hypothetical protein
LRDTGTDFFEVHKPGTFPRNPEKWDPLSYQNAPSLASQKSCLADRYLVGAKTRQMLPVDYVSRKGPDDGYSRVLRIIIKNTP